MMKLNYLVKSSLNDCLNYLKGRGRNDLSELIHIILDENKTVEDFKDKIPNLDNTHDLDAQWILGICYENGLGVARNPERAAAIFQQAAAQRHAGAQNNLGICYLNGFGVEKDLKRAAELFQQAAAQEYARAQFNLGICYEDGLGVEKDLKRAAELYQQAAAQRHAGAQNNLGICYLNGLGVEKDLKRAAELFQQAAAQEYTRAQFNLGICYEDGLGVEKDLKRAAELYQQAAEQGHAGAQTNLGLCYENGLGVAKDLKRAEILEESDSARRVQCFQALVNEKDDKKDHLSLGFCYQLGLGTERDLTLALQSYQKALANNQPCFWDIFLCHRAMGANEKTFSAFYRTLRSYDSSDISNNSVSTTSTAAAATAAVATTAAATATTTMSDNSILKGSALSCLAYLYERGAPYLDQNLFQALATYEKLNFSNSIPARDKAGATERASRYANLRPFKKALIIAFKEIEGIDVKTAKEGENVGPTTINDTAPSETNGLAEDNAPLKTKSLVKDVISIIAEYGFNSEPEQTKSSKKVTL